MSVPYFLSCFLLARQVLKPINDCASKIIVHDIPEFFISWKFVVLPRVPERIVKTRDFPRKTGIIGSYKYRETY